MIPADLSSFWARTKSELAETKPNPALEEAPEQSGREFVTYQVTLDSFQGRRIRAWYSAPKDPPFGGKLPAVLAVPGYGGDKPILPIWQWLALLC
jgi:cephalosporin-C deacetylase-like acetyl esterase